MDLDREIRELKKMAMFYRRRGKLSLAAEILRTVLRMQNGLYGTNSLHSALTLYELGEVFCDCGEYREARPYFEQAVEIWQGLQPNNVEALLGYSNALTRLQDALEAEMEEFDSDQQSAA